MVTLEGGELVVAEIVLAGQQTERIGLHRDVPGPLLRAHGAVAPPRALVEVDVRLEADTAAMTRAVIGRLHRAPSSADTTA